MTVLVDTSVWVEFLRGTGSAHHRWLRQAVERGEALGWSEPVMYELTAGAGSRERAQQLRALLRRGPLLAVAGLRDWDAAADLYRAARSRGSTIRSTVDCLIAAVALRTDVAVIAHDRDYRALADVSELRLIVP